jgi:hypothetical protein
MNEAVKRIPLLLTIAFFVAVSIAAILLVYRKGENSEDAQAVAEAIRQLAPEGGTGTKSYLYESGALKEVAHWQNFGVAKIDYYQPSGRHIYTAVLENGGGLLISLDENGEITEIYQTKNYVYDGARFTLRNGAVSRIVRIESDEVVSEVDFDKNDEVQERN